VLRDIAGKRNALLMTVRVPCMFSSLHSRPHSIRKRMLSNIYSKSTIHSSPAIASHARIILYSRLLPVITASTDPCQVPHGIDVHDLWNATTMDFITAYQFGISNSSNFLKNVAYRQHWLELYQSRKKYTFFPQELPRLTKFMHALGIRLFPQWVDYANQELEASCARMCKTATEFIATKESFTESPADEPVVLSALLAGITKEKMLKGSDSVLKDTILKEPELSVASEMIDHLAAGHETSAIAMTYLTWHLSRDIRLQDALRAELLTLDPPIKYPPPPSSTTDALPLPSSGHLGALPLLHAILMETLRVEAPIPGAQPRMTPAPSCNLAGYEIPGGVRVCASAFSLHRNIKVFPYPDTWDHTRWLDGSKEGGDGRQGDKKVDEARKERDRWFWAFSSGGRMCVGSNFAMHGTYNSSIMSRSSLPPTALPLPLFISPPPFGTTTTIQGKHSYLAQFALSYPSSRPVHNTNSFPHTTELKLIVAAVYTNFRTHIVNDDGIEQTDGYTCGPKSNRLILRFEKV
jgi:cytochrome P450